MSKFLLDDTEEDTEECCSNVASGMWNLSKYNNFLRNV